MLVLGIEGTAWNLSVATASEDAIISEAESTYIPTKGGIHPRDAAQHHASEIKRVISNALDRTDSKDIDAIAFSQGPGMGPCLRTVATAARALSLTLNKPLIGVNHCIAHIEIGRWRCNMKDPIVLYVSGANSQVLSYKNGKYRVFGETLDTSIGNALDKLARYLNLKHPGGPKIEELAKEASKYVSLSYVVKGMDFSFSGLVSAAISALNSYSMEDICYSFQETAFAMLVEVTERALAHCDKDEVLLVGGVGANQRLRQMLDMMCADRGVKFASPERKYLRDNGAMIAYTGLIMLRHDITTPLDKSEVKPDFRPDDVAIKWL